ncbi:hypothetical protein BaRGS_00038651, partial [Batillaria attramentaria]
RKKVDHPTHDSDDDTETNEDIEVQVMNKAPDSQREDDTAATLTARGGEQGQDVTSQPLDDDPGTTVGVGSTDLSGDDHLPRDGENGRSDVPSETETTAADQEPDTAVDVDEPSVPRRSGRSRKPPDWQVSGEYVMAQQDV